jgi:hypothetical protein
MFPLLIQEGWIPAWLDNWEGKQEDGVVKHSVISTLCPNFWVYIRNDKVSRECGKRSHWVSVSDLSCRSFTAFCLPIT